LTVYDVRNGVPVVDRDANGEPPIEEVYQSGRNDPDLGLSAPLEFRRLDARRGGQGMHRRLRPRAPRAADESSDHHHPPDWVASTHKQLGEHLADYYSCDLMPIAEVL
jgi:hypothetical protein